MIGPLATVRGRAVNQWRIYNYGAGFTKYLTIMPNLRSTYDGRLIHKTSYEGRKAFLWCDSLAKL